MTIYRKAFAIVSLCFMAGTASAIAQPLRATITGREGTGRCTIEVSVDGTAEIEVTGGMGLLRTFSAQEALWQRFQCNRPLPAKPIDFRVVRIEGRGMIRLVREPSFNGGTTANPDRRPKSGPWPLCFRPCVGRIWRPTAVWALAGPGKVHHDSSNSGLPGFRAGST